MYPSIKSHSFNESSARAIYGNLAVDTVLRQNCEPTSRVIDDCFGVVEFSATCDISKIKNVEADEDTLTVLYLVDKDDFLNCDSYDQLDFTDYTFISQ